jgi:hypothetical protein
MMSSHSIGNGFDWVICDFGFATFTSDSKAQLVAGLKRPNTKGITFRYASPEVTREVKVRMGLRLLKIF